MSDVQPAERPGADGDVLRRTAANSAVSAVSQIVGKLLTLAWILVVTRALTQQDVGALFFALALGTLVASVAEWGLDAVLVREASRDPSRLSALTSSAVVGEVLIGVPLLVVAGVVSALPRSGGERVTIVVVLAATALEIASDTCRAAAQAAQRQQVTAVALMLQRFATAALVLLVLALGGGVAAVAGAYLVATVVGAVAHVVAVRRLGVRLFAAPGWRRELRPMFAAATALGLSSLALIALAKVDTILLEMIKGDGAVAVYASTYRLLDTALFVSFALGGALLPVMSAARSREQVTAAFSAGVGVATVLYLPFAVVATVEAPAVLRLLFGASYATAGPVLQALALAPLAYAVAYLGNGALTAIVAGRQLLLAAVVGSVLNVALNLVLIPFWGATGAAIATTAAYAAQALLVVVLLRRASVRLTVARPVVVALLPAAAMGATLATLHFPVWVGVPVATLAYGAVWVLASWRLDPGSVALVRRLVPGRASAA